MADQAIEKQLNFYKSNFYKSSFGPRLTSFLRAIAENETGKYAYIYAGVLGAIMRKRLNSIRSV